MADYNGTLRSVERIAETCERDFVANNVAFASTVSQYGNALVVRPIRDAQLAFVDVTVAVTWYVNRGKNTGAGPAFVYWSSPSAADPTGVYYSGSVPFGQLTGMVVVSTYFE